MVCPCVNNSPRQSGVETSSSRPAGDPTVPVKALEPGRVGTSLTWAQACRRSRESGYCSELPGFHGLKVWALSGSPPAPRVNFGAAASLTVSAPSVENFYFILKLFVALAFSDCVTKWEDCFSCVSRFFSAGRASWVSMVSHGHSLKMLRKIARVYLNKDAKVYCMTVAMISKSGMGYKVVFGVFCASVMHC